MSCLILYVRLVLFLEPAKFLILLLDRLGPVYTANLG